MRRALCLLLVGGIASVAAQGTPTVTTTSLVDQSPCTFEQFESQSAFTRQYYSKDELEGARDSTTVLCEKIHYLSDGLKVVGYIVRPFSGTHLPVIVFNRGGVLDIGKLDAGNLLDFYQLASQGFVVVASQYRGNDGGEGHEEFGGADVDDVLNLGTLARELPYADPKNVFMYGVSRGGMMTFLALRRGAQVNAAAVVGAVIDVEDTLKATLPRSPGMVERVLSLIPSYGTSGPATLRERSVINWPEAIDVPVLILYGTKDDEVPTTQSIFLAEQLERLKKPHDLVAFEGDIHEIARHRHERDAKIISWFRQHLAR